VRSPFSHVGELSEGELRRTFWDYGTKTSFQHDNPKEDSFRRFSGSFNNQLNERENKALRIIREYYKKYNKPITVIEFGKSTKRRKSGKNRGFPQ